MTCKTNLKLRALMPATSASREGQAAWTATFRLAWAGQRHLLPVSVPHAASREAAAIQARQHAAAQLPELAGLALRLPDPPATAAATVPRTVPQRAA